MRNIYIISGGALLSAVLRAKETDKISLLGTRSIFYTSIGCNLKFIIRAVLSNMRKVNLITNREEKKLEKYFIIFTYPILVVISSYLPK